MIYSHGTVVAVMCVCFFPFLSGQTHWAHTHTRQRENWNSTLRTTHLAGCVKGLLHGQCCAAAPEITRSLELVLSSERARELVS